MIHIIIVLGYIISIYIHIYIYIYHNIYDGSAIINHSSRPLAVLVEEANELLSAWRPVISMEASRWESHEKPMKSLWV